MTRLIMQILIVATVAIASAASASNTLILERSWVDQYKNQILITADCFVDVVHKRPNAPAQDGDLHMAVRCPHDVDLSGVAEIMNAGTKAGTPGVAKAHAAEGTGKKLPITGVWRLWPEHAGSDQIHSQLKPPSEPFDSTNPDHLFEIHPITELDKVDLLSTFGPIEDLGKKPFEPKDAERAFGAYARTNFSISYDADTIKMVVNGVGYNYVKFELQLTEAPIQAHDGYFAYGSLLDLGGEMQARRVRTVFVSGTEAANVVAKMNKGDCRVVLGIPRIDLALVSWRVQQAEKYGNKDPLSWTLPYEMVVVGVYDNEKCNSDE